MENNSTGNGDKRSWRDRLGIGTKELPRIAEEFKPATPAARSPALSLDLAKPSASKSVPAPGTTKAAPRSGQPVAKPAPMAPRASAAKPAKVEPVMPVPPSQPVDAFSERLKAQREAAEKLAEQRVMAARQKAEQAAAQRNKSAAVPASSGKAADTAKLSDAPKPKFSFVEDETSNGGEVATPKRAQAQVTASLSPPKAARPVSPSIAVPPPRTSLGAERPPLPPRTPASAASEVPLANNGLPLPDRSSSYVPPPPVFPSRPLSPDTSAQDSRSSGFERPPYYNTSALPPLPDDAPSYGYPGGAVPPGPATRPQRPQMRGPMAGTMPGSNGGTLPRGLGAAGVTEFGNDDIFERPPVARPQRRVSAGDYQNAYREADMGYGYEAPRSNAPWVLLLLIALTSVLAAAGVWYYQTHLKPKAVATETQAPVTDSSSSNASTTAPVVKPPETQAKVVPEPATAAQPSSTNSGTQSTLVDQSTGQSATGQSVVPATTKKEIYDRIVGDREVLGGQIVPTEEQPIAPGGTPGADATTIQDNAPVTDPAASDGDAPLPLPEPTPTPPAPAGSGSGQEGSLDTAPAPQSAASAKPNPIPAADTSQAADASLNDVIAPVPGEAKGLTPDAAATPDVAATLPVGDISKGAVADGGSATPAIEPPPASPPQLAVTAPVAAGPAVPQPSAPAEASIASLSQDASSAPAPEAVLAAGATKPADQAGETISDTNTDANTAVASGAAVTPQPKPTSVPKKEPAKVTQKTKPAQRTQTANKNLGSKPVVLVPSENASSAISSSDSNAGNVLYGEAPAVAQSAQTQKKRTLLDLLNKKPADQGAAQNEQVASIAVPQKRATALVPQTQTTAPAQRQQTVAPVAAGGFMAQLSSFRSQAEASQEFGRIRSQHPAAVAGLSPIVTQVQVAGSTRYRLAVGPTRSRSDADRVCAQLFAEGERDCIVKSR